MPESAHARDDKNIYAKQREMGFGMSAGSVNATLDLDQVSAVDYSTRKQLKMRHRFSVVVVYKITQLSSSFAFTKEEMKIKTIVTLHCDDWTLLLRVYHAKRHLHLHTNTHTLTLCAKHTKMKELLTNANQYVVFTSLHFIK